MKLAPTFVALLTTASLVAGLPQVFPDDALELAARASPMPLLQVTSASCGASGATSTVTATTGPNGAEDWLNCGLTASSGWNPAAVNITQLYAKDLTTLMSNQNNPFAACAGYIDYFNEYGKQFSIPPIYIAAIAMTESSCNPRTIGAGGEQGLMQLPATLCNGLDSDGCQAPEFNIKTGAKYFKSLLTAHNGNVLMAIGAYDGWFAGMTKAQATAAAQSVCCLCQQDLDYVAQFVNGWLLGIDPFESNSPMGKYFNLNRCA